MIDLDLDLISILRLLETVIPTEAFIMSMYDRIFIPKKSAVVASNAS